MKIYILSHTAVGNYESEFYVDGVFSSMERLNAAKLRIKDELPRVVDTWNGTINPDITFKVSEHELDKEFDDSKLSFWDIE
ncbi:hypothetical protein [Pediococcus acidilactici]|uniref:DUF7336 domain-containing protein n=1 Tax=Pediococcus acidilactici TaxID=1254 RepID=UPI00132A6AA1|nr:hypothetical protein [Pediococcus acidilactici]KAF0445597.1 hypothetical protein GBO93_09290 [Pediococcus acidilactici]KAF0477205.1 hypothetical protein GBP11_09200 [Pediococcus acidilactici]KAF0513420.1 hypothetical protein GBP27_08820 [Pediococcus acidilactici]